MIFPKYSLSSNHLEKQGVQIWSSILAFSPLQTFLSGICLPRVIAACVKGPCRLTMCFVKKWLLSLQCIQVEHCPWQFLRMCSSFCTVETVSNSPVPHLHFTDHCHIPFLNYVFLILRRNLNLLNCSFCSGKWPSSPAVLVDGSVLPLLLPFFHTFLSKNN